MPGDRKQIAVVVRAPEPARVAEALRAALGLGLRGDAVHVLVTSPACAVVNSSDRAIQRALATLGALGHEVHHVSNPDDLAGHLRAADAIEVWS